MNVTTVLRALAAVGPITAALPAFKALFDDIVATFSEADQALLKDAYADIMAANDATHERLKLKLEAAAAR